MHCDCNSAAGHEWQYCPVKGEQNKVKQEEGCLKSRRDVTATSLAAAVQGLGILCGEPRLTNSNLKAQTHFQANVPYDYAAGNVYNCASEHRDGFVAAQLLLQAAPSTGFPKLEDLLKGKPLPAGHRWRPDLTSAGPGLLRVWPCWVSYRWCKQHRRVHRMLVGNACLSSRLAACRHQPLNIVPAGGAVSLLTTKINATDFGPGTNWLVQPLHEHPAHRH